MAFRFRQNERGFSNITFPFMRNTIIPATRFLFHAEMTNRQYMPLTGPCFIYGNHSNYFDPFCINMEMTTEPTAGVMTRDQFHKTMPRIFMDSIGIVPTSKYIPEPGVIRQVIRMIDQKRMIVIFPEGGRRWDGRPKPIIEATLKLFWRMKVPVHPVQLHGSYLSWPRWAKWPRRSNMEVHWLEPLHTSDFSDFDSFAKTCLSRMDFNEYEPPERCLPYRSWRPAAGIERLLYRCPVSGESGTVRTYGRNRVTSRASTFDYEVNNASRLIDKHGEPHSLIDMYDRMRDMEMNEDQNGSLLEETGSRFFTVDDEHRLIRLSPGAVRLTSTSIEYSYGSEKGSIPLESIRYLSVEQAQKFSVTDHRKTLQFTLRGSALQWQHYLRRLQNGEKPVRNL